MCKPAIHHLCYSKKKILKDFFCATNSINIEKKNRYYFKAIIFVFRMFRMSYLFAFLYTFFTISLFLKEAVREIHKYFL